MTAGSQHEEMNTLSRSLASNVTSSILPDFSDEAVRRRLGPSALELFRRVMDIWQVPGEESRQLLALEPETDLDDLDPARLSEEQLLRISYLLGIYKALHIVHSDELADCWVPLEAGDSASKERTFLSHSTAHRLAICS